MEKLENWLYILGFIVYFLLQLRSARKKQSPTTPQEGSKPESDQRPGPITFEEVLKEILEERKQPPAPKPEITAQPAVTKRNSPMTSQALDKTLKPKHTEASNQDDEARSLELIPDQKKRLNKKLYPQLETNIPEVGLGDDYQRGSIFKEFETSKPKESKYAKLLRNPASLKEAIVAAEILKPKF